MRRISQRAVVLFLATIVLGLSSSCSKKQTIRFRMTVQVETPEGLRTGSSVMEISAWNNSFALNGHVRGRSFNGEAISVELPGDRTLFALVVTERPASFEIFDIALDTLDPTYNNDWVESVERVQRRKTPGGSATVSPIRSLGLTKKLQPGVPFRSNYPMLVTFRDIKVPASVERVDPQNLSASFGLGYRIRAITVEETDRPITQKIGEKLPWLSSYWERSTLIPNPPAYPEDTIESEIRLLGAAGFSTKRP
ncbi:MAG: hypothetical protein EOP63_15475 [Sphingomonadales bacterium]|nr:MAG: hypothetical protein EOP63_15475 [Sphingomonadales bacterium]